MAGCFGLERASLQSSSSSKLLLLAGTLSMRQSCSKPHPNCPYTIKEWASITSLGILFHCVTILIIKNFFPLSNLNLLKRSINLFQYEIIIIIPCLIATIPFKKTLPIFPVLPPLGIGRHL